MGLDANDALPSNVTDCFSSIVETIQNQGLSLVGGSAAGGAVGQQVSQRRHNKEKEAIKQELADALQQVGEINQLQEQLLAAEEKAIQLQGELSTLSAGTSSALVEAAKAAVEAAKASTEATKAATEAAKAATEATKAATEVAKVAAEPAKPPVEQVSAPVEEVPAPVEEVPAPVEEAPAPIEEAPAPVEPAAEPVPDDLKRIKGIGPVFEGRLNQAGISTFAELAELEPEQIIEIVSTGRGEKMLEPEEWIAQARQFAAE